MQNKLGVFPDRPFDYLARMLMSIAVVLMALMALHVLADICSRLLFRRSLEAVTEVVSYYYMVGIIFLPLLSVRRSDSLMKAEILETFMSPRVIWILDAVFDIVLGLWFLLFTYITAEMALGKMDAREFVETTTGILSVWPTRWFLPVGTGVAALYCLLVGARQLLRPKSDTAKVASGHEEHLDGSA
ncbi:MAG: TRAP transporter small permease subunit [Pigmentiphaga sp.]